MFDIKSIVAEAHDLEVNFEQEFDGREAELTAELKTLLEGFVKKLGGNVSVTGSGHFEPVEGRPGDKIHLDINSLPRPSDPGPSSANPPEASVTTPQASDASSSPPPAGVPQPLIGDPPPAAVPVTESPAPSPVDSAAYQPLPDPAPTPSVSESPVSGVPAETPYSPPANPMPIGDEHVNPDDATADVVYVPGEGTTNAEGTITDPTPVAPVGSDTPVSPDLQPDPADPAVVTPETASETPAP